MQRCIALPARCRVGKIQPPPPWTQSFFVSLIKNIAPTPSTQCFFVAWTNNSISLPPSTRSFFVALTKNYFSLPTQHEVVLSRGERIISLPPPHQRKVSLLRWPKNCISLPTSTRSCFVAWWTNNFSTPTPSTQSFFVALTKNYISLPTSTRSCFVAWWRRQNNFALSIPLNITVQMIESQNKFLKVCKLYIYYKLNKYHVCYIFHPAVTSTVSIICPFHLHPQRDVSLSRGELLDI